MDASSMHLGDDLMPNSDYPFYTAKPLPPAYDLSTALKMLGLKSRQAFRQARLDTVLKSLTGVESRITLFDADKHHVFDVARFAVEIKPIQERPGEPQEYSNNQSGSTLHKVSSDNLSVSGCWNSGMRHA